MPGLSWVTSTDSLPPSTAASRPTQPASLRPPTSARGADGERVGVGRRSGTLADVLQGIDGVAELVPRRRLLAEVGYVDLPARRAGPETGAAPQTICT